MDWDNQNSWSCTKYNLFTYCKRKYYFYYFAGNEFPNMITKISKCKMNTFWKDHCKRLFLNALKTTFLNTQKTTSKNFISVLYLNTFKLINKSKLLLTNKDTFITEIENNEITIEQFLISSKNYLTECLKIFQLNPLLDKLVSVPSQAKLNTAKPLSFAINNITVINAPQLAWVQNGKIYNFNFFISDSINKLNQTNWDIINAVNALYWQNRFKINAEEIETVTTLISFMDKKSLNIHTKRNLHETFELIKESYIEMKSLQTYNGKIFKENYPKTNFLNKCPKCIFSNICC